MWGQVVKSRSAAACEIDSNLLLYSSFSTCSAVPPLPSSVKPTPTSPTGVACMLCSGLSLCTDGMLLVVPCLPPCVPPWMLLQGMPPCWQWMQS
jgi:hypothetical protein